MITEAQPGARPWDGHRILRFLTGLAMLALAVTLRLPGPAVPAPAPASAAPAATVAAAPIPAEVTAPDPAVYEAERIEPEAVGAATAPASVTFTTRVPRGETPETGQPRAPPAR